MSPPLGVQGGEVRVWKEVTTALRGGCRDMCEEGNLSSLDVEGGEINLRRGSHHRFMLRVEMYV